MRALVVISGLVSQLVSHLVWDAVSASLGIQLVWDAVSASLGISPVLSASCFPAGLGCCVRALGLLPKFHLRFVQLFGAYGSVILDST